MFYTGKKKISVRGKNVTKYYICLKNVLGITTKFCLNLRVAKQWGNEFYFPGEKIIVFYHICMAKYNICSNTKFLGYMVAYDLVCSCMIHIWSYIIQPYETIHGQIFSYIRPYMARYTHIWNHIWVNMPIYNNILSHIWP